MSNFIQLGWTSHRKYHDVPLQPAYYQQVCKDVGKRGRSGKYSGKPGLPLRPEQGVSHEVSFGHEAEPVLEGDGSLPEEHAEAGGGGATLGAGDPVQGGFVCHDVVHVVLLAQQGGGDGHGVSFFQPEAGGVDNEVCLLDEGWEFRAVEMTACDGGGGGMGGQSGSQLVELWPGPVDQGECRAAFQRALAGQGAAGSAAGSQQEHAELAQRATEAFLHRAGEAGAIGIVTMPAVILPHEGVDRAAHAGERVERNSGIVRAFLERNGDIYPAESPVAQGIEQLLEGTGGSVCHEPYVPESKPGGIQCRLVHLR